MQAQLECQIGGTAKVVTEDVLSPQLRQWAARKGKEEVDLHQARQRMREGRKTLGEEASAVADGSMPSGAAPKKGEPKRKGRGRGLAPWPQNDEAGRKPGPWSGIRLGSFTRQGRPTCIVHRGPSKGQSFQANSSLSWTTCRISLYLSPWAS